MRCGRDSIDIVIRCEAAWQCWLERQEERCRNDTSAAEFLILDGGNLTGVGFKLEKCSRAFREKLVKVLFIRALTASKESSHVGFEPRYLTSFIILLLSPF